MTLQTNESSALAAYLKLMGSKGATADNLARREAFLGKLVLALEAKPVAGASYREAIDEVIRKCPKEEWPFFLAVSREYYYFWVNDLKAIAALNANGDFTVEPSQGAMRGEESLQQAWKRLDNEKFDISEMWPLKTYKAALREEGADKAVVETREKLVKLLLIDLRQVQEKNGKNYRVAIDGLQPIFVMQETRNLFLTVVREFYYFWIGDPEAAKRIVLDRSTD